ncbi:indolepyruvate ferredoxin oxidoreductase family protein [Pseudohoeflea coraliihabitans]|uniref:Indolepyruvate ferredoxin oxidoreductase family protein n=1 Tax=Pseudohoeflea coraliihabitans TaxID=2860393 RepID=A0ABS6WTP1_9HYPH|nr:indolepyruvate ferredoxin oxidoreductase family protein [Pseudohoeflea sp. DP4N28-3]MBW3098429.1 indolepyruvate ferredoxin oxidoreductase family protein [Pseudohoeflea sp. DP4N28-3]
MNIALRDVSLSDRYTQDAGTLFLSGTQALVRLLITQRERDRKAGLNTSGFVSGYRGSPLGGLDMELWKSRDLLKERSIIFQPGMNEDLAATSIWGTQQIDSLPGKTVDGVFSMWYGKGPGVDRSGDAFKHGNYAGTTEHGGVLVVFGDDHPGKSSTIAHQSEQALSAHMIPVLYPANVQEVLEYGLYGWALSRHTGLWVGMKTVNETLETAATIDVDANAPDLVPPNQSEASADIRPQADYGPQRDESVVMRLRLPRVHEFARANRIDRRTLGQPGARLGVVATGKAYSDLLDALDLLGLDEARAAALGLSVYKVGMIWPVEPTGLKSFAQDCEELFFVEEKRAFVEDQAARLLFNEPSRPRITGKFDPDEAPLLPADVQLDPRTIARALASRLQALGLADEALEERVAKITAAELAVPAADQPRRIPYFCSGCPHNTSTRVPDGSVALSGIGCHAMAMWMDRDTLKPVQMGAEGANWIGLSHFTGTEHVFQNIGDGTYSHSGLLAIRAAVLAGVNITYKILANDAVAMTGGQPVEGELVSDDIVRQVLAENVERVVVVTDDLGRTEISVAGVDIVDRRELPRIQGELARTRGVTVIVYEQVCAAEKRRRRKRKTMPDPTTRVFINEDVCEGCGDCSVQSNCVSILPQETAFGRKRKIDQSSCNKDYSCVEGFCPSFVTVEGGKPRKGGGAIDRDRLKGLPEVDLPPPAVCNVLITGVGGTGVVTVGSVLAMAANLIGMGASCYSMTGMAQKGGAVYSHLRLTASPDDLGGSQVNSASADLLLGCDLVTAASADGLKTCDAGRTRALLSDNPMPTAAFQGDRDYRIDAEALTARVGSAVAEMRAIDADAIAERLLGDRIAANMFMVGYAYQMGWLPLPLAAIRKAIELNGAAVEFNLDALDLGRLAVIDPEAVAPQKTAPVTLDRLDDLVAHRVAHLRRYQGRRWAQRYEATVRRVHAAEEKALGAGTDELAKAVAFNLAKLMSYKDEYEVARLYADTAWKARLDEAIDGYDRMSLWLAPPFLSQTDPATGRPRKKKFGPWIFTAMRGLSHLRFLRGTPLDPFGRTPERRQERQLIAQYQADLDPLLADLGPANHEAAVELARLPEAIRGFGPVKEEAIALAASRRAALLDRLHASGPAQHPKAAA